ncbi:MAG: hypothetical protein V1754_15435 [Pseudomonadota bacterium]
MMKKILFAFLLVGFGSAGCDLLSSATTFSIYTDYEEFTIDTNQVGLTATGETVPVIDCANNDICSQASDQLNCGGKEYSCDIQCGAGSTCEVVAAFEGNTEVDISKEVGNQVSQEALEKVTISQVEYEIPNNTLNFKTPQIDFYVGPRNATNTSDSGVELLGTMLGIAAGATPTDLMTIKGAGGAKFAELAKTYNVPFKFFAKATLSFASGSPIPVGSMKVRLRAKIKVTPL